MKRKKLGMFQIRFKMIDRALLAAMLLLIAVTMVVFHKYTDNAEQNQIDFVRLVMEKNAVNQAGQFETFVDEKIRVLKAMASYPEIYKMDKDQQSAFIKNRSAKWGFRHVFVVDTDGYGFYPEEALTRYQGGEVFFSNIMNNDVYITEPFYADDGTAIMTACVSVFDAANKKVGVLCGAINLKTVQEVITSNEMLLEGDSFLLDRSGNFVTSPQSGNIRSDASVYDFKKSDVSLIKQAILWEDNRGGVLTLEGVEYLAHAYYLPDYPWTIVQCTPMDEVVRQFENLTVLQAVLLLAVAALIFCIIRIIFCWNKSVNETYTDALTGCNNRFACTKMLAYLEKKKQGDISIVFFDLNKFKQVNDTYGHDKGDLLLKIFSKSLRETFGKIGFVCRVGGDEFVTILRNSSETEMETAWAKLCEKLREESKTLDFTYEITSSYGYATRKKGETGSLEELMKLADERMYQYKHETK
ncbi:MAG: diguanylate cyclase [Lachnospiraceae bacterium]|nr:diguanylate cyclase [Lachnospiraceae bacterium]